MFFWLIATFPYQSIHFSDVHGKLGLCYDKVLDFKLSLYHYSQQLSLSPSCEAWTKVAVINMRDNQDYNTCYDNIQAGIGEALTNEDKALCLTTLVEIAAHFDKTDVVDAAQQELDNVQKDLNAAKQDSFSNEEDSQTLDGVSDTDISESENEDDIDEGENERSVSRGSKICKVNEKGETPLHQAAIAGNLKKVSAMGLSFS